MAVNQTGKNVYKLSVQRIVGGSQEVARNLTFRKTLMPPKSAGLASGIAVAKDIKSARHEPALQEAEVWVVGQTVARGGIMGNGTDCRAGRVASDRQPRLPRGAGRAAWGGRCRLRHRAGPMAILGLALIGAAAAPAWALPYTFTRIADTSGPFSFVGIPSLNAEGTVAFHAGLDTGGGKIFDGLYAGRGGPITTIADTSGPISGFAGFPSLNAGGVVAFFARLDAGGEGIFTGDGGSPTLIADTSGPFSHFGDRPSLNAAVTVAFLAGLDTGALGIFTGNGGPPNLIAGTSGPFSGLGGVPSINAGGTVAFFAGLEVGGAGIFTSSGGPITPIADTSGPLEGFSPVASINAGGTVAFLASLDAGGVSILTGAHPSADRVIRSGNVLDGSTVVGLTFFREGLSENGSLAFRAVLADGREGIYRADPVVQEVPEPGTLALLVIGAAGFAAGRWRRRRSA